jgi:hypothetical protein
MPMSMSLVERLRAKLSGAHGFQLMGEDLALLGGDDLDAAGRAWREGVDRLPASVRERFVTEQAAAQREAHAFLQRYNRSVHHRVAGYVELARRVRFAYPWPVVAVLGIEQVSAALRQSRVYGFVGDVARRAGWRTLAAIVDGSEDVLRRTNRGIFADSVPTVLYGLRAHALAARGDRALADALLDGPAPPLFDDESRALAAALARALPLAGSDTGPGADARAGGGGGNGFGALAALTLRHFGREQAIFTHHMGARPRDESPLLARFVRVRSVPAPVVARDRAGVRRVAVRPFALPPDFDVRDHDARVALFGRAFVTSVTGDEADYRAAAAYVLERFGRPGETLPP